MMITDEKNDVRTKSAIEGEALTPLRVCFVCTGNTCRSPMAAAVANALAASEWGKCSSVIADAMTPRVIAVSRGLYAGEGAPISQNAVLALEESCVQPCPGYDYHTHTAKTINEADVQTNDLLVAVSGRHATELLMRFPWAASKIICMPAEIIDPWGGDLATYRACLAEIVAGVETLFFTKGDVK